MFAARLVAVAAVLLSSTALAEGAVRRCDERGLELEQASLDQARALYREGKPRDAQCLLEVITTRTPQDAEAWYWLALTATEIGRTGRAAEAAERALALDPSHADAWVLAGFVAQTRGEVAEARALYQQFLIRHPEASAAAEVRSILSQLPAPTALAQR